MKARPRSQNQALELIWNVSTAEILVSRIYMSEGNIFPLLVYFRWGGTRRTTAPRPGLCRVPEDGRLRGAGYLRQIRRCHCVWITRCLLAVFSKQQIYISYQTYTALWRIFMNVFMHFWTGVVWITRYNVYVINNIWI